MLHTTLTDSNVFPGSENIATRPASVVPVAHKPKRKHLSKTKCGSSSRCPTS